MYIYHTLPSNTTPTAEAYERRLDTHNAQVIGQIHGAIVAATVGAIVAATIACGDDRL